MYTYKGIVRSVYDGDTFRADVDLGFDSWIMNADFRLYGINAPEVRGDSRVDGQKSRDWLRDQIPVGTEVVIHSIKDKKEKYGRYLAIIYLGERNLNEEMVSLGLAVPYMV